MCVTHNHDRLRVERIRLYAKTIEKRGIAWHVAMLCIVAQMISPSQCSTKPTRQHLLCSTTVQPCCVALPCNPCQAIPAKQCLPSNSAVQHCRTALSRSLAVQQRSHANPKETPYEGYARAMRGLCASYARAMREIPVLLVPTLQGIRRML